MYEDKYELYFRKIIKIAKQVLNEKARKYPKLNRESIANFLLQWGRYYYNSQKKRNKNTLKLSLWQAGVILETCKNIAQNKLK